MEYINYNGEIAKKSLYDGYYCTKSGIVLSVKIRGGQGRIDYNKPVELAYKTDRDGYYEICVSYINKDGKHKRKSIKVYKFIWETWNGKTPEGFVVDHINNVKTDNRLDNLQLLTPIENGVKRSNEWAKKRAHNYNTFVNGELVGTYNKYELNERFGISIRDINNAKAGKISRRLKKLNVILELV